VKRVAYLFLVAVCCLSLVAGCGPKEPETETPQGEVESKTLYYALENDVASVNPNYRTLAAEHSLYRQIYEPLYFYNHNNGTVENRLAVSHTISEDGLEYTFTIKEGVKFHNGEEVTAEDVAFTVEEAAKSAYIGSTIANFKDAEVIDKYTVKLVLEAPYASFLENVSQLYILPKAYYNEVGKDGFEEKPIGCGAYMFVDRLPGSHITLKAFPDYYRGEAPIKDVKMMITSDATASALALEAGEINIIDLSSANYEKFKAMDNVTVLECPSPHITTIHFNTEVAPFDNKLVRQAINYAVDREFMMEVAVDGLGEVTSNIVHPMMFGHSPNARTYEYNPEKAKELLAEAGITTPMNIGTIRCTSFGEKIAPILQENLAEIGLIADIEVSDISFIDDACKGNYSIGIMGLVVYNGVALDMDAYSILFHSSAIDAFNLPRIDNPRIDELFALGRAAVDEAERLAYYQELNELVQEDTGWCMLYSKYTLMACTSDLNVTLYAPGAIYFYDCSWK
jgi:peptide/nickel transport system substrate-binding protein